MRIPTIRSRFRRTSVDGFTLVEVLLTVAIVSILVIPLLAWLLLTLRESGDQGQPADTTSFVQVSRFVTRDVITADDVVAPTSVGGSIASSCASQAKTAGDLDSGATSWLQTARTAEDGSSNVAVYATEVQDGQTRLVRVTCTQPVVGAMALASTDVVSENLKGQSYVDPDTNLTGTAPVLVSCAPRDAGDPRTCGRVVVTVQGNKASPVNIEAARRVDPLELANATVRALISCDPSGCRGFRGQDNDFLITFDASMSTAPGGIEQYEWSFQDPGGGPAPLPDIVPGGPDPTDSTKTVPASGLANTGRLTIKCDPALTPTAWHADVGTGNPGCIYRVNLTVHEGNGSTRTASTSALIVIENASPRIVVSPNPVDAYRAVPVAFNTDGTFDPDGAPDGSDLSFRWRFGDGRPDSTDRTPTTTVTNPDGTTSTVPGHVYPACSGNPTTCTYTTRLEVSDGLTTVVQEIPVTVRNAPPVVSIDGPSALTEPNVATTWQANAVDPDGNAQRDGPAPVPVSTYKWTLSPVNSPGFVPITADGVATLTATLPFGTYNLALEVTDIDGLTVRTEMQIKVNTAPIAKARIRKGNGAFGPGPIVYSPKKTAGDPADDQITVEGSGSYDPDSLNRPGVPADPNARVVAWRWRVWGGSDWAAPTTWAPCSSNLSAEFAAKRACEIGGSATDTHGPFAPETWPSGTYRVSLAVVDDNVVESPCGSANPFLNNCAQSTNPSDGPWWVQVRINKRPTVPNLTYSSPAGVPTACNAVPSSNPWKLCRTAMYTFTTTTPPTDDDSGGGLTYRWSMPFGQGDFVPGTPGDPTVSLSFPASISLPPNPTGLVTLSVTDADGATTVVSRTAQAINHPPPSTIIINQPDEAVHHNGTWTTDDPGADPYLPGIGSKFGDPDGQVTRRRWTITQQTTTGGSTPYSLTFEADQANGTWTCAPPGTVGGMTITSSLSNDGCQNVNGSFNQFGRYVVTLEEFDGLDSNSTSTTLLVVRPAVPKITVLTGRNCDKSTDRDGDIATIQPVGSLSDYVCFNAVDPSNPSEEGNGATIGGFLWTFEDGSVNFKDGKIPERPVRRVYTRCSGWVAGAPFQNCLQYTVTLDVLNQALFPTRTAVTVRFDAPPVALAGITPGARGKSTLLQPGNRPFIRLPDCTAGCTIDLTAKGPAADPFSLSWDPDGSSDRTGPSQIAEGNYTWTINPAWGTPTSSPGASRLTVPFTLGEGQNLPRNSTIRVTDDEGLASTAVEILGYTNRPPIFSSDPFKVGRGTPYITDGVAAPVKALVAEAGNPIDDRSCMTFAEAGSTLWERIPGMLPSEQTASQSHFEWTIVQGGTTTVLQGATAVDCVFDSSGNGSGNTIVSSPPVVLSSANGATATVKLKVTDSDGDSKTSSEFTLPVRPADPIPRIDPVTGPPSNTPASAVCQVKGNSTLPLGSSPDCSTWTYIPLTSRTFSLSGAGSTTADNLPVTSFNWKLFSAATGGSDITATSSCSGNTTDTFGCTLPTSAGVYRAELTVSDGTRTATGVYYLKNNRAPTVSITPPPGGVQRGVPFTVPCAASDMDSALASTSWEITRSGTLLLSGTGTACGGTLPPSLPSGPVTLTLTATDLEGATSTTSGAVQVNNASPTASFTVTAPDGDCPAAPANCVVPPGSDITLDASASTDPDGSSGSLSYQWDVSGPGGFSQTLTGVQPPPFSLTAPGPYSITLTVTDPDSGTATASRSIRINDVPAVFVSVNGFVVASDITVAGPPPVPVDLSSAGTTDPDTPLTYQWTVQGPGVLTTSTNADFNGVTLLQFGDYTVTLVVTDALGAQTTAVRTVRINQAPTAGIDIVSNNSSCPATTPPGCVVNPPFAVVANSNSTDPDGSIASLSWDVQYPGDASFTALTETGPQLDIAQMLADHGEGQYGIRLTVVDNLGETSTPTVAWVMSNPQPTAEFPPGSITVQRGQQFSIAVNASDPQPGTGPLSFNWTVLQGGSPIMGPVDSTLSTFTGVVPTSAQLGDATVRVVVTDQYGGTATATTDITIENSAPTVSISSDPAATTITASSGSWTFSSVATDPDGIVTDVQWHITGPGVDYSTTPGTPVTQLPFTFNQTGTYQVTVTATDDAVPPATGTATLQIRLNVAPTATIEPEGPVTMGVPVQLDGSNSSDDEPLPPDGYFWQVTGGPGAPGSVDIDTDTTGTPAQPMFTFNQVGTFTVSLIVLDSDGVPSTPATTTVEVVP